MPRKRKATLPVEPLADLLAWWKQCSVPGMIIGGLAVALRGRARTTVDVDAVVLAPESSWTVLLKASKKHHFKARIPAPLRFAHSNRMLLLRHIPSGTQVDVSLGNLPFERDAIGRATLTKLGGVELPVATVEDLIVLKAVARRRIDYIDIDSLLEIDPKVDYQAIRRNVDEFAQILETPEIYTALDQLLVKHRQQQRRRAK